MCLFKLVQIFDLVSTFSWLLQFGDLLDCLCISVAFLGTETKIMGHASIHYSVFLSVLVDLVTWKDYKF
jgi:hypothetical protein